MLLNQDEIVKLAQESECIMLEQYVAELGENGHEFQMAFMDILGKSNKTKGRDILLTIRELWLETNVLHKVAVFFRQCFADPVCRANLNDHKDKNSKFARSLLNIDVMEALGLKKATDGTVYSIESLVKLYCDREQYKMQGFDDKVASIDKIITQSIKSEETVKNLWLVVRDVILERLTRKPRRKRQAIAHPKLLEWV